MLIIIVQSNKSFFVTEKVSEFVLYFGSVFAEIILEFMTISMSSYAKNKLQMCSVIQHHS